MWWNRRVATNISHWCTGTVKNSFDRSKTEESYQNCYQFWKWLWIRTYLFPVSVFPRAKPPLLPPAGNISKLIILTSTFSCSMTPITLLSSPITKVPPNDSLIKLCNAIFYNDHTRCFTQLISHYVYCIIFLKYFEQFGKWIVWKPDINQGREE